MRHVPRTRAGVTEVARATVVPLGGKRPMQRLLIAGCPDFWRLWSVGLVVFTVRWLETVAVGVFVYQHTRSAFLVVMMTMLRLLPMGLFGTFLGVWAEKMKRRTLLVLDVFLMLGTSACLALLAHGGRLAVWHLAMASFVNGLAWATDNPVRRVMIGEVVGPDQVGVAMSIDVARTTPAARGGPMVGGLLLAAKAKLDEETVQ
jgi:MFS family permease